MHIVGGRAEAVGGRVHTVCRRVDAVGGRVHAVGGRVHARRFPVAALSGVASHLRPETSSTGTALMAFGAAREGLSLCVASESTLSHCSFAGLFMASGTSPSSVTLSNGNVITTFNSATYGIADCLIPSGGGTGSQGPRPRSRQRRVVLAS